MMMYDVIYMYQINGKYVGIRKKLRESHFDKKFKVNILRRNPKCYFTRKFIYVATIDGECCCLILFLA